MIYGMVWDASPLTIFSSRGCVVPSNGQSGRSSHLILDHLKLGQSLWEPLKANSWRASVRAIFKRIYTDSLLFSASWCSCMTFPRCWLSKEFSKWPVCFLKCTNPPVLLYGLGLAAKMVLQLPFLSFPLLRILCHCLIPLVHAGSTHVRPRATWKKMNKQNKISCIL